MHPYGYSAKISSKTMAIVNRSSILNVKHDIIDPAFTNFDAETEKIRAEAAAGDNLSRVSADLREFQRRELSISFCLVIQAVWERQLSSYMQAYDDEIPDQALKGFAVSNWPQAIERFAELSRDNLRSAPDWDNLQLLHTVANACRHGAGRSLNELYKQRPYWWQLDDQDASSTPTMFGLAIPQEALDGFIVSVSCFWEWRGLPLDLRIEEAIPLKHGSEEGDLERC